MFINLFVQDEVSAWGPETSA